MIRFTVPGRIAGKGRPRVAVINGHARAYTPEATRSAEAMLRHFAAEAMRGHEALSGPVSLSIKITVNTPPSWPRKRKCAARYVTGKPDIDNCLKLAGDSFNSIVWRDDSQVAIVHVERVYNDASPEQVEFTIHDLSAPPFVHREEVA